MVREHRLVNWNHSTRTPPVNWNHGTRTPPVNWNHVANTAGKLKSWYANTAGKLKSGTRTLFWLHVIISIYRMMFAYQFQFIDTVFAYQGFNLPELCSRTPFQFTALRSFDIISIYRKYTENLHGFWKMSQKNSPLRGEIVTLVWYAKVTIKCERPYRESDFRCVSC